MKNRFLLLGLLLLTFGCRNNEKERLTVRIEGLQEDSLICAYMTPATIRDRQPMVQRMIGGQKSADGKSVEFRVTTPDDEQLYRMILAPRGYRGDGPRQTIQLFLLPGENDMRVEGKYEPEHQTIDYTLTGSPVQEEWLERQKVIEPLEMQLGMLGMTASFVQPGSDVADSLQRQMQILADSVSNLKTGYITAHPEAQLSAYYLTTIGDPYLVDSLYRGLDESVKNGPFKAWLDLQNEEIAKVFAAEDARTAMAGGGVAPDFTLPGLDGKDFTLSSLFNKEGRYIVLDFWGTWCSWCIKGMPEMKKAYAELGNGRQVEFVGIDCGDTEEAWKKGVEKHGLPWIHVRAEGDDIPVRYGIEAFPTKIILAPDGSTVRRFTGEDPVFYTCLDSLVRAAR